MAKVEVVRGNIFTSRHQTLVNPVNCVGVMGAGLALEFKLRYPEMFDRYVELCRAGRMEVGKLWLYGDANAPPGGPKQKRVLNFPTKKHWRWPSRMEYLDAGLRRFIETYRKRGITSVAFPLLGAQNGGLDEQDVLELMQGRLAPCDVPVEIYRFEPTAEDEWINPLRHRCRERDETELARETAVARKRVATIRQALERNGVSTVGQLASLPGIGEKTVARVLDWLRRVEEPSQPTPARQDPEQLSFLESQGGPLTGRGEGPRRTESGQAPVGASSRV